MFKPKEFPHPLPLLENHVWLAKMSYYTYLVLHCLLYLYLILPFHSTTLQPTRLGPKPGLEPGPKSGFRSYLYLEKDLYSYVHAIFTRPDKKRLEC